MRNIVISGATRSAAAQLINIGWLLLSRTSFKNVSTWAGWGLAADDGNIEVAQIFALDHRTLAAAVYTVFATAQG